MSLDPMHTPGALNWDPASVDLPEIPMLPPGEDAMSMTIAGVLPTLTAPMAASVAALQAKETMFSGKLGSAQSAYQNADDQGGQAVGQFGQMLGQLGQMAGQAGAPAQQLGQQAGQFGSMIQQAMQAAQGGGVPSMAAVLPGRAVPSPAPLSPAVRRPAASPRRREASRHPVRRRHATTPLPTAISTSSTPTATSVRRIPGTVAPRSTAPRPVPAARHRTGAGGARPRSG